MAPWQIENEKHPSRKEELDRIMAGGITRTFDIKKPRKGRRPTKWRTLVQYDEEELKAHIQALFLPGMKIDNYGVWHVDHIVPKWLFWYTSSEDPYFKACWSLQNLQPLWKRDNIKKGVTIPSDYQDRINNLPYLNLEQRSEFMDRISHIIMARNEYREDMELGVRLKQFSRMVAYFATMAHIENYLVMCIDGKSSAIECKGLDVIFPNALKILRKSIREFQLDQVG